ncbi:hypothetical protein D3C76_28460 [compost metagenome]
MDIEDLALTFSRGSTDGHEIIAGGGEADAGQLVIDNRAQGLGTKDLEHLTVLIQLRTQVLVVDATGRFWVLAAFEHEQVMLVADLAVIPVVWAEHQGFYLAELLGWDAPDFTADALADNTLGNGQVHDLASHYFKGDDFDVFTGTGTLAVAVLVQLAIVFQFDDEAYVVTATTSPLVHHDAVDTVTRIHPAEVLHRVFGVLHATSIHIYIKDAGLVAEVDVAIRAVAVNVQIIAVEPCQRDTQLGIGDVTPGSFHLLLDGVGDVAVVRPCEVVWPLEQLADFCIDWSSQADKVVGVLVRDHHFQLGSLRHDIGHELFGTDGQARDTPTGFLHLARTKESISQMVTHDLFGSAAGPEHVVD